MDRSRGTSSWVSRPSTPDSNYFWKYPISGEYREWYQLSEPGLKANTTPHSAVGTLIARHQTQPIYCGKDYRSFRNVRRRGGLAQRRFRWHITSSCLARKALLHIERTLSLKWHRTRIHTSCTVLSRQYTGELIFRKDLPGTGSGGSLALELSGREKNDPQMGESIPPGGPMGLGWRASGSQPTGWRMQFILGRGSKSTAI